MSVLESIDGPDDLKRLDRAELSHLAVEIRDFLVDAVSKTGGHLGPNLGAVELTIALHRVFDSPRDKILFDTGHQAYVHKLLTGRKDFSRLRKRGGLSGYPSQAESEHDIIENSHASTALSYADGLAKAFALRGEHDRAVVAVVGDGALTGGMCWEAMNNIAGADLPVIIVVNDNGRSYAPTIGGLARHLADLRVTRGYERALDMIKKTVPRAPVVGPVAYEALHGVKKGLKDVLQPQAMFEDLGLKYVGPIDGHDIEAVEHALRRARGFGGPVIVHCITRKGYGYAPAENNEEDCMHGGGAFDPATGRSVAKGGGPSWTKVFGQEMVQIGAERSDVVAITAAMLHPVGLGAFAEAYPDRIFDVGIAEQHAVTSAAGLAMGGLHPVVAVYATFLNRAFDQVLMDVALHRQPVTFVLDRAGVTGDDGPSHNGMWDLSILQLVPGLRIAVPRDGARLRELLRECLAVCDGPTALRFPKGAVAPDVEAIDRVGAMDVLARHSGSNGARVLLVAVGPMAATALEVADRLAAQGIGVTVLDPRWVKPLDAALPAEAGRHTMVAVVEDNGRVGAVGDAVARLLRDNRVDVPVRTFGIPQEFPEHASRAELLADFGLTPQALARDITEAVAGTGEPTTAEHVHTSRD
ncbi:MULTISPECIES: 1-deoxy-D-xylulose-5-phosphate synthase [Thermomonospora]|uniref:1-deoxy-D-xylulose-5-phosphate synthase n=1 Tax=Thermomonospora curvata (strain ATCC 19995 / DSM 43183 / JCM 3096 / KCTC 9072 / NBRC 15933 / NCIMB 10081 / Henssen B9) TaxID=471852 RepID=D1AC63_THECD|nr:MULTISPECIES: 1-deoxy-D-xylulose-5-phosphate synthase [Thermomonospora]ACY97329.1 deoxyxylulose-5-phosphate synthase [Thermomonospora curvata DSM 43183]PKK14693.1 MAG: 1-deoxy-D-xylulose-5-phosphate synthase [Thermomonospora sp. CIF 1]